MVVHLVSPDGKYDTLYLRNYARLHVKDELARLPGVGEAQHLRRRRLRDARLARPGQGRLARPDRRRRGARDARAERAGLGRPARRRADAERQRLPDSRSTPRAACSTTRSSATSCSRAATTARSCASPTSRALELGAGDYTLRSRLDDKERGRHRRSSRRRAPTRWRSRDAVRRQDGRARRRASRRASNTTSVYDTDRSSCAIRSRRW